MEWFLGFEALQVKLDIHSGGTAWLIVVLELGCGRQGETFADT